MRRKREFPSGSKVEFDSNEYGTTQYVQSLEIGVATSEDGREICLCMKVNNIAFTFDDDEAVVGLVKGITEMWPEVIRQREEKLR